MTHERQRWIEAGKTLAASPLTQVPCPRCEDSCLEIQDVRSPNAPEELERIMRCPKCGAVNVLRLRRPLPG